MPFVPKKAEFEFEFEFEFAEVVRIKLKKDVPFFQNSPHFEYRILSDDCGHKFHGAFFFKGLHEQWALINNLVVMCKAVEL